jgi:hypothetical protein
MDKLTSSLSGLSWTALVSFISYALSAGFTLPPEMNHFKFYALLSTLVGFGFTNILSARSTHQGWILLISLVFGSAAAAYYSFLLQTGATAGSVLYFELGGLLTVAFVSLGVALRTAGLTAEKSDDDSATTE